MVSPATEQAADASVHPDAQRTAAPTARSHAQPVSPHAERLEFVKAFVLHASSQPNPERLVTRPHIAVLIASLAAIGALIYGLVVGLFKMGGNPMSGGIGAPPAAGASFSGVTGWGCRSEKDRSFEARGATGRWVTLATGGWAEDGCSGQYAAIPMSGEPNTDDPAQRAIWSFKPGKGMSRCAVSVYLPRIDNASLLPAPNAYFTVLANLGGKTLGTFQVDQTAKPGDWVEAGTVPIDGETVVVQLGTRGKPTDPRQRLIASQVRVECGAVAR